MSRLLGEIRIEPDIVDGEHHGWRWTVDYATQDPKTSKWEEEEELGGGYANIFDTIESLTKHLKETTYTAG